MDQNRRESQLEIARRYVALGEQRISRLNQLIEKTRAAGKPTDDLERLLKHCHGWLVMARVYLEFREDEAAGTSGNATAPPAKISS